MNKRWTFCDTVSRCRFAAVGPARKRYQSIAARTTGAQQRSDRRMSAVQQSIDINASSATLSAYVGN